MGGHGATGHYAVVYLRITAIGLPSALVALAGQGYLRGISNLRTPLLIVVAGNVLNLVLELVLVYALDLGIRGSAWGTAAAQTAMGAAFVVRLIVAASGEWHLHAGRLAPSAARRLAHLHPCWPPPSRSARWRSRPTSCGGGSSACGSRSSR